MLTEAIFGRNFMFTLATPLLSRGLTNVHHSNQTSANLDFDPGSSEYFMGMMNNANRENFAFSLSSSIEPD
jgi:hypothetical protein